MVEPAKPEHPVVPHHRAPLTGRQIIAQVIVAAVILVSGIAIGSGGAVLALKDRIIPKIKLLPADPGPGPGPEPNFLVERWTQDYGLSEKQAGQVKETLIEQWAGTHELWQKFMQAEQTQRQKFAEAMKKILTPEQYEKWEGDLRKRFEHFRGMRPFEGRPGGRGGPRGDRPREWRMDPNAPRGGWPPRDPNERRGGRGPDRFGDREGPPEEGPPGPIMDPQGTRPPEPPTDADANPDRQ